MTLQSLLTVNGGDSRSDHRQVLGTGMSHGGQGDRLVEGDEPGLVGGRERQQIGIGDLAMAVQFGVVKELRVEQTDRARPVLVVDGIGGMGEPLDCLGRCYRTWVPG